MTFLPFGEAQMRAVFMIPVQIMWKEVVNLDSLDKQQDTYPY